MDMELEKDEGEVEKEQHRLWMNYLSLIYSQRPEEKEPPSKKRAREEFVETLKPKQKPSSQQQLGPAEVYDWDFERLKRIQQKQKGG